MNKSMFVHLRNKYPHCKVSCTEQTLDVHDPDGEHLIAYRKNGQGVWEDAGKELGTAHAFCAAPIPKHSRHWKLNAEGNVVKDEKHDVRRAQALKYVSEHGRVPSIFELSGEDKSLAKDAMFLSKFEDSQK